MPQDNPPGDSASLGRLGVWTHVDGVPAPQAAAYAKRIEDWGYSALWLPEAVGRDPFADSATSPRTRARSARHRHREHLRARRR